MTTTYLHERADGTLVEYRLGPSDRVVLRLESRVLRPGGMPYDDRWYPASDRDMVYLQVVAESDIVERIAAEHRELFELAE